MGDAVVPAERVFVEENPAVSHAKRNGREIGCQHAPAAEPSASRAPIEAGEFKSGQTQPRSRARVDHEQVLVGRPEQAGESGQ